MIGRRKTSSAFEPRTKYTAAPMSDLDDILKFKQAVVTHIVMKYKCFIAHYDCIPAEGEAIFNANARAIEAYTAALRIPRGEIGTFDAYMHLIRTSTGEEKQKRDLSEATGIETYYEGQFGAEVSSAYTHDDEASINALFDEMPSV